MHKIFKYNKKLLTILVIISMFGFNAAIAAPAATKSKPAAASKTAVKPVPEGIKVDPVRVVDNPSFYLNKNITFEADFVAYTSLGLDSNPALRSSSDYIGILIGRTDVTDHVIPLSEMKIFLNRPEAEKHIDLEQGDKIKITGTVFSNALGDPWVDVKAFSVVKKADKKK